MDLQHGFWIGYVNIRSFFLYLKAVRREILLILLSGFRLHTCADDHLRAPATEVRRSRNIRRRTCTID